MISKKIIKARDVMRVDFTAVDGKATVADAIKIFMNSDLRLLIVNKRDEFDAYGVVLLSDIIKKVLAKDRAVERVNLYEIMSKPAVCIEPDLDVRYCARLFNQFNFSHTLVVEAGKVLGVIGYSELLVPWAESAS